MFSLYVGFVLFIMAIFVLWALLCIWLGSRGIWDEVNEMIQFFENLLKK